MKVILISLVASALIFWLIDFCFDNKKAASLFGLLGFIIPLVLWGYSKNQKKSNLDKPTQPSTIVVNEDNSVSIKNEDKSLIFNDKSTTVYDNSTTIINNQKITDNSQNSIETNKSKTNVFNSELKSTKNETINQIKDIKRNNDNVNIYGFVKNELSSKDLNINDLKTILDDASIKVSYSNEMKENDIGRFYYNGGTTIVTYNGISKNVISYSIPIIHQRGNPYAVVETAIFNRIYQLIIDNPKPLLDALK